MTRIVRENVTQLWSGDDGVISWTWKEPLPNGGHLIQRGARPYGVELVSERTQEAETR